MTAHRKLRLIAIGFLTAVLAGNSFGAAATEDSVQECQREIRTEQFRITVSQVAFNQLNDTAAAGRQHHQAAVRELAETRSALAEAEAARRQVEGTIADLRAQIALVQQNATRAHESEDAARQHAATAQQSVADLQRQIDQSGVPSASSAAGSRRIAGGGITDILRRFPYQKLLALTVGAAGLLSVLDAALFTQCAAVGATAVAVGVFADGAANDAWQGSLSDAETFFVGVEGAVITIVAAHVGFEGFELVVGVCLALGSAHLVARWAVVDAWQAHVTFAWFALSTVFGLVAMQGGQKAACAVIGSIGGGLLAASSCIFFWFSFLNATGVSSPCWVDFAGVLLTVGAISRDFTIMRAGGYVVWACVALTGTSRYFVGVPSIRLPSRSCHNAALDDEYRSLAS